MSSDWLLLWDQRRSPSTTRLPKKKKKKDNNVAERKKRWRVSNKAHPSIYIKYKEKHSSKAECTSAHLKKKKSSDRFYGCTPLALVPREEEKGRCWRCCHTHHQNAPTQRRCVAATTHLKALVYAGAAACCKRNEAESYFILFNKQATRVVTAKSEGLFSSNVIQAFPFVWR